MITWIENIGLVKGKQAAGIELHVRANGSITAYGSVINKSGSNLSLKKSLFRLDSYDFIQESIPKELPVCLTIDGKGILYKKVTPDPERSLINHLLPNATEKDFYVFQYPAEENQVFLAAIRKEQLDSILDEFKNRGLHVVYVDIGPFPLNNVMPAISRQDELKVSQYKIKGGKKIENIEKNDEYYSGLNYRMADESVDSLSLVSFSAAVNYFTRSSGAIELDRSRFHYEEFLFGRLIKIAGLAFLGLLFVGLIVNYLYFDYYSAKYNRLSFQLNQNKDLITRLDTLKEELKLKEQYVVERGYLSSSKLSYYSDRIARTIPNSIILNRLEIHLVNGKIKVGEEIDISKDEIIIKGVSDKNMVLNAWMGQLKEKDWVREIRLINYTKEKPGEPGDFIIQIMI